MLNYLDIYKVLRNFHGKCPKTWNNHNTVRVQKNMVTSRYSTYIWFCIPILFLLQKNYGGTMEQW